MLLTLDTHLRRPGPRNKMIPSGALQRCTFCCLYLPFFMLFKLLGYCSLIGRTHLSGKANQMDKKLSDSRMGAKEATPPNETKSGKYLFFTFSRALYTPSAVKYKGSKFVVSQTLLTLTKIIGRIIFMISN